LQFRVAATQRDPGHQRAIRIGGSSLGELYLEGHRIVPAGVLDNELVLPALLSWIETPNEKERSHGWR
jgi:hypothetical protein